MKKVLCIKERDGFNTIKKDEIYYLDEATIYNLDDEIYAEIYKDNEKQIFIGRFLLNHFAMISPFESIMKIENEVENYEKEIMEGINETHTYLDGVVYGINLVLNEFGVKDNECDYQDLFENFHSECVNLDIMCECRNCENAERNGGKCSHCFACINGEKAMDHCPELKKSH